MLSCKDVSSKVSESLDRKLSMREQFGMKMHLLMCKYCRRMVRQLGLLQTVFQRYLSAEEERPGQELLPKEAGVRILERLRREKTLGDHNRE